MEIKSKILVVEDDPSSLKFITEVLNPEFQLATARTGEEALARIGEFFPDVVLLDIMLPGIDGYEVCKQIQANTSLLPVKVILVSAKATLDEKLKGYKTGADDYLIKPYQYEELLAKTRVFARLVSEERKRQIAEESLKETKESLECAVQERTKELASANIHLKREIEGRRKSDEELQISERKFRQIFENSQAPYIEMSVNGIILEASPSVESYTQYKREELIGRSALDFYADPESGNLFMKQLLETGELKDEEIQIRDKNGSVLTLLLCSKYLPDEQKVVSSLLNITDRKRAEEARQRSENLLQTTQHIARMGGWEWDLKNQTMFWTEEAYRIHGFEQSEFVPGADEHVSRSLDCYLPEDQPAVLEAFQQCGEKGQAYDLEFRFNPLKGSQLWVRTIAEPVWENGEVVRVLGAIMDITERKQAKDQLEVALKEKETLLHEIHHRVKNNMQVINSLLNLQANNIEDTRVKEILKESQSRIYAMSAVHETLHGSEKLSEINLKHYFSNITTSIFQTYFTGHDNVKLHSNIEDLSISINQAYPLGLIINELISNSLKYAFPDKREGDIFVTIKELNERFELTVKDNGVGTPEGFDWKNSNTLGLKLVRTLVEDQLNGLIEMDNQTGTKFTITFKI